MARSVGATRGASATAVVIAKGAAVMMKVAMMKVAAATLAAVAVVVACAGGVKVHHPESGTDAAKGMPRSPPYRHKAYLQTGNESTLEVVRDLGNFFTLSNSNDRDVAWEIQELRRWARRVPMSMKVLRLIEEGRKAPATVAPLLRHAISESIDLYDQARDAREATLHLIQKGEVKDAGISEDDAHYAATRRYENPIFEFDRLYDEVYSSFYILANIGQMDRASGRFLAQWINKQKAPKTDCRDMDAWLIDQYYRSPGIDSDAAHRHLQIIGNNDISGAMRTESAWDASWSINDPMFRATKQDRAKMRTIKVLNIPPELPPGITPAVVDEIIANFKGAFAPTP